MQGAMPIIKAWENTLPVLGRDNRQALTRLIPLPLSLLQMLIDFENEFGEKVLQKLPEDMLEEASKQVCPFDTKDTLKITFSSLTIRDVLYSFRKVLFISNAFQSRQYPVRNTLIKA